SRSLIDLYAPHIHFSIAVAREIQISAVWRPTLIPIAICIVCHFNRLAALCRYGPDISLAAQAHSPVSDSKPVRRATRLHGIAGDDLAPETRLEVHREQRAWRRRSQTRYLTIAMGHDDLVAVARPDRRVAGIRHLSDAPALFVHYKDAACLSAGPKDDLLAVGGKRGLNIVELRACGKVERLRKRA